MKPALMLALLAAAAAAGACSRPYEPARWVETVTMANEAADQALAHGDFDAARARLAVVLDAPAPIAVADRDRRVVLQDACFRLAVVELAAGRPQAADAAADRGLALGQFRDLFAANLLLARARAREQLGQTQAAATDYHDALLVNEELLREALP